MSTGIGNCKLDHDEFCFVCGLRIFFTNEKKRTVNSPKFIEGYINAFHSDPRERNEQWSPQFSCENCYKRLTTENRKMNLSSSMEWFEPKNHPHDCYFCQTIIPAGTNKKKRAKIEYANVPSVKRAKFTSEPMDTSKMDDFEEDNLQDVDFGEASGPMEQGSSPNVDVMIRDDSSTIVEAGDTPCSSTQEPFAPITIQQQGDTQSVFSQSDVSSGIVFRAPKHYRDLQPPPKPKEQIVLIQARMNDIIRDLDLSKDRAELLASRLVDMGLGERK